MTFLHHVLANDPYDRVTTRVKFASRTFGTMERRRFVREMSSAMSSSAWTAGTITRPATTAKARPSGLHGRLE